MPLGRSSLTSTVHVQSLRLSPLVFRSLGEGEFSTCLRPGRRNEQDEVDRPVNSPVSTDIAACFCVKHFNVFYIVTKQALG